jgi:hypothetical protein
MDVLLPEPFGRGDRTRVLCSSEIDAIDRLQWVKSRNQVQRFYHDGICHLISFAHNELQVRCQTTGFLLKTFDLGPIQRSQISAVIIGRAFNIQDII